MYVSYPYTSIPRCVAAFATLTPMAPSPITPSFFPAISLPAKFFFCFSASFATSALPSSPFTHSIPPTTSRAANNIPANTSSFTPFAFAPGVLNTTIPASAHLSNGILFTPAPALATTSKVFGSSISCIAALLTKTACASLISSTLLYSSDKRSKPTPAIGFKHV